MSLPRPRLGCGLGLRGKGERPNFDVTTGTNQIDPDVPGYPATTGWDPVTGLGTPNAATLLPALVAASH